jgi:hypothetical protein
MKGHTDPHRLKWGAWRAPVKHSIRRVSSVVKRVGEKSELSTTERGSTKNPFNSSEDLHYFGLSIFLNRVADSVNC